MDNFMYNIISIFVSLFVLLSYTISSYVNSMLRPSAAAQMQLARTASYTFLWIRKHCEKSDAANTTLAIQTLRNTIFVAIFTAGVAFQSAVYINNTYPLATNSLERIRVVIISVLLFLSFLSWASVIRSSSHLGYYTGVLSYHDCTLDEENNLHPEITTPTTTTTTVNNTASTTISNTYNQSNAGLESHYNADRMAEQALLEEQESKMNQESHMMYIMLLSFSLGFRFLFIALPFLVYVAGPEALLIGTFLIVCFMYYWDYSYIYGSDHIPIKPK